MKLDKRLYVLSLAATLFVLSLALLPGGTSASKPEGKDKRDRTATTKRQPTTLDAERQPVRESDLQPVPTGAPQAPPRPGVLKRIGSFLKDIFVSRSQTDGGENGQESDPDLPPSLSGKINMEEYLTARQGWVNMKLGMTPGLTYDPTTRSRAIEPRHSLRRHRRSGPVRQRLLCRHRRLSN